MALHLVGETVDKTRSHYQAETGKLVQLMRGVYVDADDADAAHPDRPGGPVRHRRPPEPSTAKP